MSRKLRNIAIIAHVDHGKTTLVDQLLKQSGTFRDNQAVDERVMDSNDLERERGITILAKNTAIMYGEYHINIVDTPGHADFGGEVERVLGMVDGVVLLVDAVEGPMPQTRFVTKKALALGLKPIVVINKVDRPGARPNWVVDQTFDLFDKLHATDEQLDFPIIYASGLNGWACLDLKDAPSEGGSADNMTTLFDTVIAHVPTPPGSPDAPLQLQIAALDYSTYTGRLGVGRVLNGRIKPGMSVVVMNHEDQVASGRINQVLGFKGLERVPVEEAEAGDIIIISGLDDIGIGVTVCDRDNPVGLPVLPVDEPTLNMDFMVNASPLAGTEGKFVTSRQIRERLKKELLVNVALRVDETGDADVFRVSGRGELHLTILLENMRREGFEMAVGKPRVVYKEINGEKCEPYENLTIDLEDDTQGTVMEEIGRRRGELTNMESDGQGRTRLEYFNVARSIKHGISGYVAANSYNAISDTRLGAAYAVHVPISSSYYLSMGLSTNYNRLKADMNQLVVRDPQDPYYISFQNGSGALNYFTLDAGVLLYSDKLYAGYSTQRLVRTRFNSDVEGNEQSNIRHTVIAGYTHSLNEQWEIQPGILFRHESTLKDLYNLSLKVRYDGAIWGGVSLRPNEALSLLGGYQFNNMLSLGYSYDMSIGSTSNVSQGSHEIILGIMPFNKNARKALFW